MKNILQGIIVGIINIIPGISGGTALVFLGIFNQTVESISNIFTTNKLRNKKNDILFLLKIGVGVILGSIIFAKIINYLFTYYFVQTIYWFIGLIVFSLPIIIKNEMQKTKFSILYFIVGLIIIGLTFYLNIETQIRTITEFPKITITHLLEMLIFGTIGGIVTIIPGISGSMVLLILGKYYLIQSYIAESITFQSNIIISLIFFGIGAILGIIIGAKIISYYISKYKSFAMSTILGLIVMSSIVLIPTDVTYNFNTILSSLVSFLFGGSLIKLTEYLKSKKVHYK